MSSQAIIVGVSDHGHVVEEAQHEARARQPRARRLPRLLAAQAAVQLARVARQANHLESFNRAISE